MEGLRPGTVAWAAIAIVLMAPAAGAETLQEAMAAAYVGNPTLNAARAELRATDENVPQALAGYRPILSASADIGGSWSNTVGGLNPGTTTNDPYGYAFTIEQPLFRGFRTANSVTLAETSVRAGREALRNSEQNVLLDAVTAYMNVVRDREILALRSQNITFLREQVRAANDRLNVGEGTRTDVAQTEARLSAGISEYNLARANLDSAIATYIRIVGREPRNLRAGTAIDRLLPKNLNEALGVAEADHPTILAANYNAEVAGVNVKIITGELLPSVSVTGSYSQRYNPSSNTDRTDSASVVGRLSVPIYSGGSTSSRVRQAKERQLQRQIEVDAARDLVRANAVSTFAQLDASRAQVTAAQSQVSATRLALEGVTEERRVGQRTTLDVLDAQAEVLNARINLISAQRNRVVGSYAALAAVGRLSAQSLGLNVPAYQPEQHYREVRDKWFGLRTPDGR